MVYALLFERGILFIKSKISQPYVRTERILYVLILFYLFVYFVFVLFFKGSEGVGG